MLRKLWSIEICDHFLPISFHLIFERAISIEPTKMVKVKKLPEVADAFWIFKWTFSKVQCHVSFRAVPGPVPCSARALYQALPQAIARSPASILFWKSVTKIPCCVRNFSEIGWRFTFQGRISRNHRMSGELFLKRPTSKGVFASNW